MGSGCNQCGGDLFDGLVIEVGRCRVCRDRDCVREGVVLSECGKQRGGRR